MAKRRSELKVFLDSSVMFTAVNSPIGGSAKLFTLKNVKIIVSRVVLHEVEKNVRKKLQEVHLKRFFMLVKYCEILTELPDERELLKARKVIVEKDSAILSEFKQSDCSHLITLDKRDFLQDIVRKFIKPKEVVTPKEFIEWYD